VLARGEAYVLRDLDGSRVTPEQARRIIAERYAVTDQVRRRRRSRKAASAPPRGPAQVRSAPR
jgi:hypothetical protein